MTDHTKALADALTMLLSAGRGTSGRIIIETHEEAKAREALAAYRAAQVQQAEPAEKLDRLLWEAIDYAASHPTDARKIDPRTWEHLLVYSTLPPPSSTVGEREAFEAWGKANNLEASDGERGMKYPLGEHLWRAWQARAALAPAAQAEPVAWRPIETAPKDGTRFLAVNDGWHEFFHWQDGANAHTKGWPIGWRSAFTVYREGTGPTHWMPLPAAPGSNPPAQQRGGE